MALRCPFLTKIPMNLIKSQPAAVLKFAEVCPFASANFNLSALKAFSSFGDKNNSNVVDASVDGHPQNASVKDAGKRNNVNSVNLRRGEQPSKSQVIFWNL